MSRRLSKLAVTTATRVLAVTTLLAATACTSDVSSGTPSLSASSPPTATRPTSTPTTSTPTTRASTPTGSRSTPTRSSQPADAATRMLAGMSEAQRVGQLLMVDCPSTGVAPATKTAIMRYHVGSVILDGTSWLGVQQTEAITAQLQDLAPPGVGLFVSTDQEGGLVQRLRGPGFSQIPSAVTQGGYSPASLQADAHGWGRELRNAGVNLDLAPVLDTVPPGSPGNPPIGDLDREYGHDPATVSLHGVAVAQGLAAAGVDATVKHFPGLGRVAGNTDVSSGVRDTVTRREDAYLQPFTVAVGAQVPFVMISTAIYTRIDPVNPAAFSPTVITDMLRHDLGFTGVVISDDLGNSAQVSGYHVGRRAVMFVAAGGDMVLTVDASQAAAMTSALLAATADPKFKEQVDAAALVVLRAKEDRGLLH